MAVEFQFSPDKAPGNLTISINGSCSYNRKAIGKTLRVTNKEGITASCQVVKAFVPAIPVQKFIFPLAAVAPGGGVVVLEPVKYFGEEAFCNSPALRLVITGNYRDGIERTKVNVACISDKGRGEVQDRVLVNGQEFILNPDYGEYDGYEIIAAIIFPPNYSNAYARYNVILETGRGEYDITVQQPY